MTTHKPMPATSETSTSRDTTTNDITIQSEQPARYTLNHALRQLRQQPHRLSQRQIIQLQRTYGNQWVLRHLASAAATSAQIQRSQLGQQMGWLVEQQDDPFPNLLAVVGAYESATENLEKQRLLHEIEHIIYGWLTAHLREVTENPLVDKMLDFMDVVQAEHQIVVKAVMSDESGEDEKIYGHDENGGYSKAASEEATTLLALIKAGTASIRINPIDVGQWLIKKKQELVGGFEDQVLAAFARLLTKKEDREMVGFMLVRKKIVTIIPMTPDTKAGFEWMQQQAKKTQEPEPMDTPGLVLPAPTELSQKAFEQGLDMAQQNTKDTLFTENNLEENAEDDSPTGTPMGTNAYLALEPGMKDSEAIAFDEAQKPIPTPEFVTLGHELRHAFNIQVGMSQRGHKDKSNDYPNLEEANAIEGTENDIRARHNLGKRKGHTGARRRDLKKIQTQ
jgi:hypothetical protein